MKPSRHLSPARWVGLFALSLSPFSHADSLAESEQLLCRHAQTASAAAPDSPDHRKYAPDRKADMLHLALDVTPNFADRTVSGTATLTFKPIAKSLEELRLDGVDLKVSAVEASAKVAEYQVTTSEVIVTFAKPIPPGKETKLTIKYSAQPAKGLYFRAPSNGYKAEETQVWTQGESDEARHWYPAYDYPNEKFTTEMICHVPEGMTVLSNGRQASEQRDARTGLVAVHWRQDKPHVNYLVSLVAGYFKKVEDKHRDIPLEFHVSPADLKEAPNSFRDTRDIMAFFEREIGVPYPWDKYGQVTVRDFHWGGMENTSLTTLTDRTLFTPATENIRTSQGLVAHELAHQWFGDLVTCKDWSHIWLNEGFATYYAHLYDAHKNGRDSMLYGLLQTARSITQRADDTQPIVFRIYTRPDDRFRQWGYLAYGKGGWVLHMLRAQLGDDLYRRCIQTYLQRHQFDTVVTEDLNAVIEEFSGRSFDRFFDQWVYHAHHPELEVAYAWDAKSKLAKVSVKQTQKVSDDVLLFQFPLTIRFKSKSGAADRQVQVSQKEEDFYFPLKEAPDVVRIDPDLTLLAKITFTIPDAMLHAQLADKADVVGRLLAIEQLGKKKNKASVDQLKQALNGDPFYGVRIEAAGALRSIHSDDALAALLASTQQPDARVRHQVFADLGKFYHDSAYAAAQAALGQEKNPDILAQAVRTLGAYAKPEVRELLVRFLNSESYRNGLADAAIAAIREQDDPGYIAPLREILGRRTEEFTTAGFAAALDTLAFLARNETKKDAVREYLAGFVNDRRERLKLGAIKALGTLEDPKAVAVLETFASAAKDTPEQKEAEKAITAIKAAGKPADNLRTLRGEVLDLQKENRRLGKEVEDLKKKLSAH